VVMAVAEDAAAVDAAAVEDAAAAADVAAFCQRCHRCPCFVAAAGSAVEDVAAAVEDVAAAVVVNIEI